MDTATLSLALLLTFVLLLFFVVTIVALNEGMFTRNSDAIFFLAPLYAICWVLPSVLASLAVTHFFM